MGIMGWSVSSMATRYQHLTGEVQHDIARRIGGLIWKAEEDGDEGTAGVPAKG